MVKYICKNCNHEFESKNAFNCPQCDGEWIEIMKNAPELLKEIEDLLEDG